MPVGRYGPYEGWPGGRPRSTTPRADRGGAAAPRAEFGERVDGTGPPVTVALAACGMAPDHRRKRALGRADDRFGAGPVVLEWAISPNQARGAAAPTQKGTVRANGRVLGSTRVDRSFGYASGQAPVDPYEW